MSTSPTLGAALERLESAGLVPSPEESLDAMLAGWSPLLRQGADQLNAELSGAELLATLRASAPNEAILGLVLADLLTAAESAGSPRGPGDAAYASRGRRREHTDTAFRIFLLMASRRLRSDRFLTVDLRPEVYTPLGMNWIERGSMTGVLLRHCPELARAVGPGKAAFAPWR